MAVLDGSILYGRYRIYRTLAPRARADLSTAVVGIWSSERSLVEMEQRALSYLAFGQELVEERFADVMCQECVSRSMDFIDAFERMQKGP